MADMAARVAGDSRVKWTDEGRAELHERWGRHETASAIGAAMGVGRMTVLAELHRTTPLLDGKLPRHAKPESDQ